MPARARGRRRGCRPRASASRIAPTISPRTRPGSRKRTSALAGCTLTSTSAGSSVRNSTVDRIAVARQHVGIGAADRAGDQLVAHRPAVDIGILLQRVGAVEGRQRDVAGEPHAFALGVDGDRVVGEVGADHLGDARKPAVGVSPVGGRSSVVRSVPDSVKRTAGKAIAMRLTTSVMAEPSARSLFMNFSRAGVAKNRSRTSTDGAAIGGGRPHRRDACRLRRRSRPLRRPLPVRERIVSRATEPIDGSASPRKPSVRMSWMSSTSLEVQWRATASSSSPAAMPRAVVADPDQRQAAAGGDDLDAGGAGVERVLDQFLDHARRPLDDLAGGDLVDHRFGKLADGHGGIIQGFGWRRTGAKAQFTRCCEAGLVRSAYATRPRVSSR